MLFYVMLLGAAPILGTFFLALSVTCIAEYLGPIVKGVLIGAAAIILIPRLLPAVPVIIVLAVLVAVVAGAKRIVGFLLG
jgi:hypothetical protein